MGNDKMDNYNLLPKYIPKYWPAHSTISNDIGDSLQYLQSLSKNLSQYNQFRPDGYGLCCEILLEQPTSKEEKKMTDHLIDALQTNYKTVKVQYSERGSQLYTLKVHDTLELEVGDLVLVQASRGDFYRTVKVISIDSISDIDYTAEFDYKWIVSKIDLTPFNNILEQEQKLLVEIELIKKRNKRQEVLSNAGLSENDINHLIRIGKSND